jgi:DNA-binding NtrC family response regulator
LDAEGLERWLVEAAPQGRGYLEKHLASWFETDTEKSQWKKSKQWLERALLEEALQKAGGNRTRAAQALGVHRNTVLWHLRKTKGQKKKDGM